MTARSAQPSVEACIVVVSIYCKNMVTILTSCTIAWRPETYREYQKSIISLKRKTVSYAIYTLTLKPPCIDLSYAQAHDLRYFAIRKVACMSIITQRYTKNEVVALSNHIIMIEHWCRNCRCDCARYTLRYSTNVDRRGDSFNIFANVLGEMRLGCRRRT
jgi:hypothetical protein